MIIWSKVYKLIVITISALTKTCVLFELFNIVCQAEVSVTIKTFTIWTP